jgi:hypothetical protein
MFKRTIGICMLGVLLAACQPSGPGGKAPQGMANDPHLVMQQELENSGIDFSNVLVVRLLRGSERVEISSVLPAILVSANVAGQPAKTIFRVNPSGDGLILFSRDVPNGKSFRADLNLAELEKKKSFVFPLVQPDGSLKEQSFALEKIVRPNFTPAKP